MKPTRANRRISFRILPNGLRTMGLGVAIVAAAGACSAQTGLPGASVPEQLPPPVTMQATDEVGSAMPYIPAQPLDARHYPLWQGYQTDKVQHVHGASSCECQSCKPKKLRPVKKFLGKLTHGLDVMLFGACGNGQECDSCGSCDSGCDADCDSMCATNDGACDAMGPVAIPMHTQHHVSQPGKTIPQTSGPVSRPAPLTAPGVQQPQPLPVNKQVPAGKTTPTPPKELIRPQQQDPFADDPITVTGRATIKPASFRR